MHLTLSRPTGLNKHDHQLADLPYCVLPLVKTRTGGAGILTRSPSPTPFGLGLGPANPWWTNLPKETLDFRRMRFSLISRYSYRHSHFHFVQQSSQSAFNLVWNAPLPLHRCAARGFGAMLSPVTFSAQNHLTSELLRTL